MAEKFYITTPIYYPSDKLHIGHTYCTVATDTMARYKRMCGYDVLFLTGTDEHGLKIEQKAKAAGITPQQFVDNVVCGKGGIRDLWKLMNISNDRFIRTTDDYHVKSIQKIFEKMHDNGDIYKGAYKGKYCVPCESFWTDSQLVDGKCPDCGREVQDAEEEAYFFRLSKYQQKIEELLSKPGFLEPESRRNEMMNNFVKPGLEDLCVSRTSFTWGIPVTFDPGHVVYVWVDALSNYITALGYMNDKYDDYDKYWPCDVHFIGKEIVRFHSIIWPAMLMSLGEPLPKKVYGHGWLLLGGGKISKSKANTTVNVIDPIILAERYGVDALRYYLLREFPFGSDGNFSNESLIKRINIDLANDLGNLVSRTTAMAVKYFGGTLPAEQQADDEKDAELIALASGLKDKYYEKMESYTFQGALVDIFEVISRANKYIDENAPWVLAKNDEDKPRLARVLYNLLEAVRICTIMLTPFMPDTTAKVFEQIGAEKTGWEDAGTWGLLPADVTVHKGENLFPRIDLDKELETLKEIELARQAEQAGSTVEFKDEIDFETFEKVDMTVCKVKSCENVKKSKKLLKFILDDGSGKDRQILSGIAAYYKPEELVGKTVVAVTNLAPRKMMGQESCGMLLSAEKNDKLQLIILDDAIEAGAKFC